MSNLSKNTFVNSFLWNAIEKYSSEGIRFLVSIIMARILTPNEYGILGLASVFISFADIFINSGLSNSLICKKKCKIEDYRTVNCINIAISIVCYAILYVTAPLISAFYNEPILTPTIRVLMLSLIVSAISGVGRTKLLKEMQFKKLSIISLTTSIFSGIVGIAMAYNGFGVWALIYQVLLSTSFSTILILVLSNYLPKLSFSKKSFKELFSFGSKILVSDIIWVIFNNIYPIIIGKGFNAQSVGYFSRAWTYSSLIPSNLSGILATVLFPAFSQIQDDRVRLEKLYKKSITISTTLNIIGNFILIGVSYPLILNMLSAKWLPCVPLLQILCLGSMFSHIDYINGRMMMAIGQPGIFLKIQTITKPISLVLIAVSIMFGLNGLAWGQVVISIVSTTYNCILFNKITNINPFKVLSRILMIFIIAGGISLTFLLLFKMVIEPTIINLIATVIIMTVLNIFFLKVFEPSVLYDIIKLKK